MPLARGIHRISSSTLTNTASMSLSDDNILTDNTNAKGQMTVIQYGETATEKDQILVRDNMRLA
jgi:hypothetical protein